MNVNPVRVVLLASLSAVVWLIVSRWWDGQPILPAPLRR